MAVPTAPTDLNGAKVLFLLADSSGSNVAAILRAVGVELQNGELVGHLAVATHVHGQPYDAADQLIVTGGVDTAAGQAKRHLVDPSGRAILRPALAHDAGGGTTTFSHPRTLKPTTINGESVGHSAIASHLEGDALPATHPIAVVGANLGSVVRALVLDAQSRLKTAWEPVWGDFGHKNVAVAGTRVPLLGSATPCRLVKVKADPANAATIYLGDITVTNDDVEGTGGFQLGAGQESPDLWITDVASLYINGTNGDGVSFVWWT